MLFIGWPTTIAPAQQFSMPRSPKRLTIDHVASTHWLCHREWNSSKWKSLCARLFCLHVTIMMIGVFMSSLFSVQSHTYTHCWIFVIAKYWGFQTHFKAFISSYATDNTSSYRYPVCFVELETDYVEWKKRGTLELTQQIDHWLIDSPLIDIYVLCARHDGFALSVFNIILRWCL